MPGEEIFDMCVFSISLYIQFHPEIPTSQIFIRKGSKKNFGKLAQIWLIFIMLKRCLFKSRYNSCSIKAKLLTHIVWCTGLWHVHKLGINFPLNSQEFSSPDPTHEESLIIPISPRSWWTLNFLSPWIWLFQTFYADQMLSMNSFVSNFLN